MIQQATPTVLNNETNKNMLQENLIEQMPNRRLKFLIFVVSMLCLAPFYYGFILTNISVMRPDELVTYFGDEAGKPLMIGLQIAIIPIGAGTGALMARLYISRLSRKKFLLIFNFIALLMAGLVQINNLVMLLICRFVQGFVIGNYMAVVPIYIKQITPFSLRGTMGAMSQFFIIFGQVLTFLLALIFRASDASPQFIWRFLFSFTGLTVLFQTILLLINVIPESPASLVQQGKLKQARQVLSIFNTNLVLDNVFAQYIKISKRNKFNIKYIKRTANSEAQIQKKKQLQMMKPTQSIKIFKLKDKDDLDQTQHLNQQNILMTPSIKPLDSQIDSKKDLSIQIQSVVSSNKNKQQKQKQEAGSFSNISLKAFIIAFQIPLMQQFSGVKSIITQSGVIFLKYDENLSLYAPLIVNVVQFVATAFSLFVLLNFGRRVIILTGNLGVAICGLIIGALFLATDQTKLPGLVYTGFAFILVFIIFYGLTIGPVVWLYVPQIIPSKIVPLATFMNWFGTTVSVLITPVVIDTVGSAYPLFFFFGTVSIIFYVMNYYLVIQTKGLSIVEIEQKLK